MRARFSVLTLAAAAACSPGNAYVPTSNATSTIGGRSADYPVPPEQPRGDVRIASFGFADLTPRGVADDEKHALHALHLRMIVANDSDQEWTLDTRQQGLALSDHGESAPPFAVCSRAA